MSEELSIPARAVVATNAAPKAIGPYSQGIRAGSLVFTSGQIALHPETQQVVPGGIQEQTQQVFANLKAILEAAGSGFAQTLIGNPFVSDTAFGSRMFHCSVSGDTFTCLREPDLKNPTRICAGLSSVK